MIWDCSFVNMKLVNDCNCWIFYINHIVKIKTLIYIKKKNNLELLKKKLTYIQCNVNMIKKYVYCIGMCFVGNIYAGSIFNNDADCKNKVKECRLEINCFYKVDNDNFSRLIMSDNKKEYNCIFDTFVDNNDMDFLKKNINPNITNNLYSIDNNINCFKLLVNKSKIGQDYKILLIETATRGLGVSKDGHIELVDIQVQFYKTSKCVPFDEFLKEDVNARRKICILFCYKRNNPNFADNMQNDGNNTHGPIITTNIMPHTSHNLHTSDDSWQHNHQTLPGKHIPGGVKKGVNSESNTGGCCRCKAR